MEGLQKGSSAALLEKEDHRQRPLQRYRIEFRRNRILRGIDIPSHFAWERGGNDYQFSLGFMVSQDPGSLGDKKKKVVLCLASRDSKRAYSRGRG